MTQTIAKTGRAERGRRAGAPQDRIAVVAGIRTPFARAGTAYRGMTTYDLACQVVRELVARTEIDPREIGTLVYGQAVPSPAAPNIAREVVLGTGLPKSIEAFSVVRACATSFQATTSAAESMLAGQHDVAIVGGADSASDVPITVSRRLAGALATAQRAKTLGEKLRAFASLGPKDFLPTPPALEEPSTGLTMGEHAEMMAKDMAISREEQDRFALRSHTRAGAAWSRGIFDAEVMQVLPPPTYANAIVSDNVVRSDGTYETYAKLPPVFDRRHGSVTAGSSCALTDGASALLLMTESKAKSLGYEPLGFLRSWAYAALDPADGLLGPAYATPLALDRAGLTLSEIDVVDMHEAFAAQVLANRRAIGSRRFAEEKLGRSSGAIGELDDDRFNVHGGSIAIGHPFAATGARILHTLLRELRRRGGQFGLATACAAGGLGTAVIVEAA